MKLYKSILLIFTLLVLFTSCEDMLTEVPLSSLSTANFYKTKSDAIAAVNTIYQPIRSTYGGSMWGGQFTGVEDYAIGTGTYAPLSQGVMNSACIARTDNAWRSFYQAIRNANIVLKYVPPIPMDDTEKKAILAEARFLRALCYYNLVRSWAGVPIRTEPVENGDQAPCKRATVQEVYDFIISDLKDAEINLPSTPALAGKPTKWAAKTMLADVYLTREKWSDARDKAEEVINAEVYSLVPVTEPSDFELIFGPTAITSSEDVFSLKFSRTHGGTVNPQQYAVANSAYSRKGWGSFYGLPTFPLLRDWDHNDLRWQFDIYFSYPTRDGTIVPNPPDHPIMFGKFKDPGYNPSHGNDFPIYRYPDALFIYAEAANQANNGPTDLALERLNMVHRRAYGYPSTEASPVDFKIEAFTTAQSFRDLILKERAYEFHCEYKRWYDLIRTKTVQQVIFEAKGVNYPDSFLLYAIPQQELDNNPEMGPEDQNPGY
jgi:hypothetical protein